LNTFYTEVIKFEQLYRLFDVKVADYGVCKG